MQQTFFKSIASHSKDISSKLVTAFEDVDDELK